MSQQPTIDAKSAFAQLWQTDGGRGAIAIGGLMYLLFPLIIPPLVLVFVARVAGALGLFACLVGIAFTIFYAGSVEFHLAGQLARSAEGS